MLTALADTQTPRVQLVAALLEELTAIYPTVAARIDPTAPDALDTVQEFLEERAVDGYPFGVNNEGEYGFWPLGPDF